MASPNPFRSPSPAKLAFKRFGEVDPSALAADKPQHTPGRALTREEKREARRRGTEDALFSPPPVNFFNSQSQPAAGPSNLWRPASPNKVNGVGSSSQAVKQINGKGPAAYSGPSKTKSGPARELLPPLDIGSNGTAGPSVPRQLSTSLRPPSAVNGPFSPFRPDDSEMRAYEDDVAPEQEEATAVNTRPSQSHAKATKGAPSRTSTVVNGKATSKEKGKGRAVEEEERPRASGTKSAVDPKPSGNKRKVDATAAVAGDFHAEATEPSRHKQTSKKRRIVDVDEQPVAAAASHAKRPKAKALDTFADDHVAAPAKAKKRKVAELAQEGDAAGSDGRQTVKTKWQRKKGKEDATDEKRDGSPKRRMGDPPLAGDGATDYDEAPPTPPRAKQPKPKQANAAMKPKLSRPRDEQPQKKTSAPSKAKAKASPAVAKGTRKATGANKKQSPTVQDQPTKSIKRKGKAKTVEEEDEDEMMPCLASFVWETLLQAADGMQLGLDDGSPAASFLQRGAEHFKELEALSVVRRTRLARDGRADLLKSQLATATQKLANEDARWRRTKARYSLLLDAHIAMCEHDASAGAAEPSALTMELVLRARASES